MNNWRIELIFFHLIISRFQPETPQASVQKSPPPQRSLFAALQSLFVEALRLLPFRMPTLETSAQRSTSLPRTILASIIAWFRSNFPELWCLKAFLVRSVRLTSFKMAVVLFLVASGYVKWLEFYKTSWKRPGIGEEADVGVIIFMAKYFVLHFFHTCYAFFSLLYFLFVIISCNRTADIPRDIHHSWDSFAFKKEIKLLRFLFSTGRKLPSYSNFFDNPNVWEQ